MATDAPPSRGKEASRLASALKGAATTLAVFLAAVAVSAVLCRTVLSSYIVPSASMQPTIAIGDRLVGLKVAYAFSGPAPGDVVTFDDPNDPGTLLIKRVVAVSGQTVDLRDGDLFVDGAEVLLAPGETAGDPAFDTEPGDAVEYPYTVPDGCVFVMGDNRKDSLDSRWLGPIPEDTIEAKALFVWYPFERARAL